MSRREISAGCVVYRICGSAIEVALIQPHERKAWALPKGLIERGEPPEQAARREAREETGLSGTIGTKIDTIQYSYMAKWEEPSVRVFKIVTFYLMEYVSGDPSGHDYEVAEAKWFELEQVENNLTYKTDKEIFHKANNLFRNR